MQNPSGSSNTEHPDLANLSTSKPALDQFDRSRARKSGRSWVENCVTVDVVPGAGAAVWDSKDPAGAPLLYSEAEWAAFIGGVRDGDFDI